MRQRVSDEQLAKDIASFENGRAILRFVYKYLLDLRDARARIAELERENYALKTACTAVRRSIMRFPGSVHDRAMAKIDKAMGSTCDFVDPDEARADALARDKDALIAELAKVKGEMP